MWWSQPQPTGSCSAVSAVAAIMDGSLNKSYGQVAKWGQDKVRWLIYEQSITALQGFCQLPKNLYLNVRYFTKNVVQPAEQNFQYTVKIYPYIRGHFVASFATFWRNQFRIRLYPQIDGIMKSGGGGRHWNVAPSPPASLLPRAVMHSSLSDNPYLTDDRV